MFCPFMNEHKNCEACGIYDKENNQCSIKSINKSLAAIAANTAIYQQPALDVWPTDTEYGRKIAILRRMPKGSIIDINVKYGPGEPYTTDKFTVDSVHPDHIVIIDQTHDKIALNAGDYGTLWEIPGLTD